jgi:hypothetical protein
MDSGICHLDDVVQSADRIVADGGWNPISEGELFSATVALLYD